MKNTASKLLVISMLAAMPLQAMANEAPDANFKGHWARVDTNNDGKISKQEYLTEMQARAEKRFKEIDANGDGFITKEEMKTYRDAHQRRRGAAPLAGKPQ